MRHLSIIVSGLASAIALGAAAPAAAVEYIGTVVASGLNNPRGLAFGPDGGLYIAEAGFLSPSGPTYEVRGMTFRYGETGSITRLLGGVQTRILTGLPSVTTLTGGEASGPQDIAFGLDGTGYVVFGLGTDPAVRTGALGSAPGALGLGRVFTFTPGGTTTSFADVAALERALNPIGGFDSNPYKVVTNGMGLLVTDAGANTLNAVSASGVVSLVASFPGRNIGAPFDSESVPTGVAVGPDGAYYVAELTGVPFTPGAARIYRVVPGEAPTIFAEGFTNISDIVFGPDGNLYVLLLDVDGLAQPGVGGAIVMLRPNGTRETIFSQGLVTPTGLTFGPDGALYVANFSAAAPRGEVLRVAAVPEPATWAMMIAGFGLVGSMMRRGARIRPPAAA